MSTKTIEEIIEGINKARVRITVLNSDSFYSGGLLTHDVAGRTKFNIKELCNAVGVDESCAAYHAEWLIVHFCHLPKGLEEVLKILYELKK